MGVRGYDLGEPCFDCDELYAVRIQGATPKNVAAVVARDGLHTNHPPLMSVPFVLWVDLFGASEVAVRGLPFVAGVAAVALLFFTGQAMGRPWAGVFAAALLAVNPIHITYSAEARQYSLLVCLLVAAHWLYLRAWTTGSRSWLVGYYLIATWAAFTHYFAVPVLAGHAALAAAWSVGGAGAAVARRLLLAVGLAGLPYVAWLPVLRFQTRSEWEHLSHLTPAGLADSLADLFGVRGWGAAIGWALAAGVMLLAAVGVWAGWRVVVPTTGPTRRLSAGPVGAVLLALALVAAGGMAILFPRSVEPAAQQTLAAHGYYGEVADAQIQVLRQTGWLFALCGVMAGVVLLAWRYVERTPPQPAIGQFPLGPFLLTAIVVPAAVVGFIGMLGVPFHQTRNLIVFLPAAYLAVGFALDRLASRPVGLVAAVIILGVLVVAASHYDAIGRLFGWPGPHLGLHTIDWRGVVDELTADPPPGVLMMVLRPATDPGLYYLRDYKPLRVPADAVELPPQVAFVHLPDNVYSQRLMTVLETRGPVVRTASGDGWELWVCP